MQCCVCAMFASIRNGLYFCTKSKILVFLKIVLIPGHFHSRVLFMFVWSYRMFAEILHYGFSSWISINTILKKFSSKTILADMSFPKILVHNICFDQSYYSRLSRNVSISDLYTRTSFPIIFIYNPDETISTNIFVLFIISLQGQTTLQAMYSHICCCLHN